MKLYISFTKNGLTVVCKVREGSLMIVLRKLPQAISHCRENLNLLPNGVTIPRENEAYR